MTISLNDLVKVLRFYANGNEDGGERARRVLKNLQNAASQRGQDRYRKAFRIIRYVRDLVEKRVGCSDSQKFEDSGMVFRLMAEYGEAELMKALTKTVRVWPKLRGGRLTTRKVFEKVREVLENDHI